MMQPPEFGVKLDGLTTETPGSILYGVTPDDKVIPVKCDDQGRLDSNVTLVGDIVVGAFIIEGGTSGKKAEVVDDGTDNALVVTANVLPLPIGAATEATLGEIDNDLTDGTQKTQIVDSLGDVVGVTSNAIDVNLKSAGGATLDLGQEVMADSLPVVIASNQSAIPVSVSGFSPIVSVQAASASGLTVNGTVNVTNFPSTQQVLASSSGGLTVNLTGTPTVSVTQPVTVLASSAGGLTVTGTVAATQSGTWTVSLSTESIEIGTVDQGTPAVVGNAWPIKITNGVSTAAITNASPVGTEQALVVRNIPSGVATVQAATVAGLTVNVSSTPLTVLASSSSGLTINGTVSVTQPLTVLASSASGLTINGTVTANIGTTNGLALDSSLTTIDTDIKASQPRKLQDGSGNSITSQVSGSQRALDVGIDVAGVQVDPRSIRALTSADIVSVQAASSTGITVSSITNAVITNADTTIGGTTAPTKEFLVAGKTNDGTPQYQPLPEGTGGRSVIVEGVAGGTAQPISATALPLPSGASTEATLASIKAKTDNLDVALSTRLKPADTLTAVTTVTTVSAVTAITNALPTGANTIGKVDQGAGGASAWKVDGSAVTQPVSATTLPLPTGAATSANQLAEAQIATATLSNVASSASNVTLLSSNSARLMAMLFNDSTKDVFVKFGTTASATSFTVKIAAGGYYEFPKPCYTGRVDAIWASANGAMRVTEE